MLYVELQDFAGHFLNLLDSGITEFKHLVAIGTNQVIVLFVFVGLFKLGQIFPELMFGNQVAIEQ